MRQKRHYNAVYCSLKKWLKKYIGISRWNNEVMLRKLLLILPQYVEYFKA